MLKRVFCLLICLFLPSILAAPVLRLLGFKIGKGVKIGFSLIFVRSISLGNHSRIGHFNIIMNDNVVLLDRAYLHLFNFLKGPFDLVLDEQAAIGKSNVINRARIGVTYGHAELKLGKLTKVTANHYLDMTRSIVMGHYSTLAGIRSQIWTHGYFHAPEGPERFRVDGEVHIGNNVYIGSSCLINPGVTIADVVTVGGNAAISKSLTEPGMYVSQPLRFIPKTYEETKEKLKRVDVPDLKDIVYEKKN
jgi:acetyltransferase-like isoleucine patch superfamily enzyme